MGGTVIASVEAIPLAALWEDLYGGIEHVPPSLLRPSANFQGLPRRGQFTTLVLVKDSDGAVGIGEAWGLPHSSVTSMIINDLLRPAAVGRDADDIEGLWTLLTKAAEGLGHTRGFMLEAISGLDIALWDLRGKRLGLPLHDLIGGRVRNRVPCYASPVRFSEDPTERVAIVRQFIDSGFTGVKIKAGRGVEQDTDYVASLREALGPDIRIMVDVNCGWDRKRTVAFAKAVEPYGVFWIEEPIPPDRPSELAGIRRSIGIRIATGENDFTVSQFQQFAEHRAADIFTPNVTRCGGITGLKRIAELAEANGADISLHGVGSGIMLAASLHCMSAFRNGICMEYNRFPNPLRETLATPSAAFRDSCLDVPEGPGLGIAVDWDVVERFRTDRRKPA